MFHVEHTGSLPAVPVEAIHNMCQVMPRVPRIQSKRDLKRLSAVLRMHKPPARPVRLRHRPQRRHTHRWCTASSSCADTSGDNFVSASSAHSFCG